MTEYSTRNDTGTFSKEGEERLNKYPSCATSGVGTKVVPREQDIELGKAITWHKPR
jgi:hypothetical protein